MSNVVGPRTADSWTAADLVNRFGAIPLSRVRHDPAPGTATHEDVVQLHAREGRLYELVDQTLVEKTVGTYESYLALMLGRLLGNFVSERNLGIVLGADGMLRLTPYLVRIPDVSFISWKRLPNRRIPDQAIADLVPDLAVEIISPGNTQEEMDRKLREYFAAGVQQVWYVDPRRREINVYGAVDHSKTISQRQTIEGGDILPGFTLSVAEFFAGPAAPDKA